MSFDGCYNVCPAAEYNPVKPIILRSSVKKICPDSFRVHASCVTRFFFQDTYSP